MNTRSKILCSTSTTSALKKYNTSVNSGFWSVVEVAEKLQGPLPVYHPEALLMNISSGNWKRAYVALGHLVDYFKTNASMKGHCSAKSCHDIPPVPLSNYLEGIVSSSSNEKAFQWNGDASAVGSSLQLQKNFTQPVYSWGPGASNNGLMPSSKKYEVQDFVESLEKLYQFAAITIEEKMQGLAIIDLLQEISNPQSGSAYESLDEPGRRYWVAVRFQRIFLAQKLGRLPSSEELAVNSGLIAWAFHSDCEDNLFNTLLPNEPSWQEMRNMGFGFWYTNATQLRLKMEKLARQQYLRNKDPKACALLYIAMNRLQVLAGLFKISKDEKDKPLVGFLARNFQDDKNKAAALKNAYVLMGRHQLELAIAFFLLGGDISSAVTVCAKNLRDEQLALVICHLVEGSGGPLERHLISKLLLPSAKERGDYWLASYFEWVLGNYVQSFQSMISLQMDTQITKSALLSNQTSFSDPSVGKYCLMLATKNSMKNAVGEQNATLLSRWATLMSATALNRCGLPLEALECLSSFLSTFGDSEQGNVSDNASGELLDEMLKPFPHNSNWISGAVAFHMESHAKLELAMQYISKLLKEHPSWPNTNLMKFDESEIHQHKILLESFQHKLTMGLAYFEQKFSLMPPRLISMTVSSLCNNGLAFMGYHVLQGYTSKDLSQTESNKLSSYPILPKLLRKTTEETSSLCARYIAACSISCSKLKSCSTENKMAGETAMVFYRECIMRWLWILRATFKLFSCSCEEDFIQEQFILLDLVGYYFYFASAWTKRDLKDLILIVKPLISTSTTGHGPCEIDMSDLKKLLHQIPELMTGNLWFDDVVSGGDLIRSSIPEDERWQIIGAFLWGYVSAFVKHHLNLLSDKFHASNSESEGNNTIQRQILLVSEALAKLLRATCVHISSYHLKQLLSFLQEKLEDGLRAPTILWLEEFCQPKIKALHKHLSQGLSTPDVKNDGLSEFEILWNLCADPKVKHGGIKEEIFKLSECIKKKPAKGWNDVYMGIIGEYEIGENCNQEGRPSGRMDTTLTDVMRFENPKEVYKRNGELLEALCINSTDQQQAALASNKKGIIFFNWEDGLPSRYQSNYVWAEADWPQNGWAGSESIPVPTPVSPGVGLGSKKGTHLGLGGATVGVGSFARPRRDLTGGGAFGIPGYAGMGASGLGWGVQEDFEEFVDPPATVENTTTRAFSSHPSRNFFLVGSCNTHTYLWEFGKEKATATYGVLPAANVPPPYALASISALQFDHCGHRFATAALDGTVCTWQLEVGGRSNIRPTESSLCFNNNASDVTYVTSSGSIIAAAGYNSSGVNVVIWDTLAPPTTSRASIMCHEGGARSLSVFGNDIGSGSISPLIVTGGKNGDVGLHDFRYVATGRTKRHRHSNSSEQSKVGDQNSDGMLWYLPKAHLGSVTKIAVIPNTSFFLTGSKDGDVKLWDAKRSKLAFHWPKLHERHTFLQPSSRGFGGVVRAAVTDIQVVSHGFLSCGGDGCVKLVQLKDLGEHD